MPSSKRRIELQVLRYQPELDSEPVWQSYYVPYSDDMSVLQGLQYIKDDVDGTLSFRWSCRMAICGSCGMMVNGKPQLSCQTFLRDLAPGPVRIEALAHFPIERDLVVNVDPFIEKLERIKPYLIPKEPRRLDQGEYVQTPHQLEQIEQFSSCINCMLCYSACPQFGLDPNFTGPGALALLHRYNTDSRDGGRGERMQVLNAEEGVWSCTAVGYCSEVCPKGVDPANAVNQNKVNSAKDFFLRFSVTAEGFEMSRGGTARRGYVRPMQGWWRRDRFFRNYMLREATSLGVLVYAFILLVGAVRLAQGEAAWDGWLAALRSPGSILLHLLLLAAMAVHAHSWFVIMPKTMPAMFAGGQRVAGMTITRIGWAAVIVASLTLLAAAKWLSS